MNSHALPPDPDTLLYRMAFASLRGINFILAREFLARLGSERDFFEASESSLSSMTGGTRSRLFSRSYRDEVLDAARRELDFVAANSIATIYHTDSRYPSRLLEADDEIGRAHV